MATATGATESTPALVVSQMRGKPERFAALDAFRGITIVLMLLVNNVSLGDFTPSTLLHADWNSGVNSADLVFPWFLLCVGLSVPFSIRSSIKRGETWKDRLFKGLSRSAVLFLIGCLIDSSIQKQPYIGFGVLQIIAAAYFIGSQLAQLPRYGRWIAIALLLIPYGLIIRYAPVPGLGSASLTSDSHFIKAINDLYLEPLGLRGILSAIPTAGMVLLGVCIGEQAANRELLAWKRVVVLIGIGIGLTAAGWLWSLNLPMNKAIWTPSYIVYCAGLGALALAACIALFDWLPLRALSFPLAVFGSNALAAYIVPILIKLWILQVWIVPYAGAKLTVQDAWLRALTDRYGQVGGGWVYTIEYIAAAWLILAFMRWRKWYLRA